MSYSNNISVSTEKESTSMWQTKFKAYENSLSKYQKQCGLHTQKRKESYVHGTSNKCHFISKFQEHKTFL